MLVDERDSCEDCAMRRVEVAEAVDRELDTMSNQPGRRVSGNGCLRPCCLLRQGQRRFTGLLTAFRKRLSQSSTLARESGIGPLEGEFQSIWKRAEVAYLSNWSDVGLRKCKL